MSYDIYLKDKKTKKTIKFELPHNIKGGTYQIGGRYNAWLNVTYNYSDILYKLFPRHGIRILYDLSGRDSIPVLAEAIFKLKNDYDNNYWKSTEGNVKKALVDLLNLALLAPDGIWDGD